MTIFILPGKGFEVLPGQPDLKRNTRKSAFQREAQLKLRIRALGVDEEIASHVGGAPAREQIEAALLLLENRNVAHMLPSEGKMLAVSMAAYIKFLSILINS